MPRNQKLLPILAVLTASLTACARAGSGAPSVEPPAGTAPVSPAPWTAARLQWSQVPSPYRTEWEKAANRRTCAAIAPRSLGQGGGAAPRAATFSGGWAVAYDTPAIRSAFGVAGTGSKASDPAYSDWPFRRRWADGSVAEYGPEGGSGPNQLAYLRITGQECLYNVWSRLGREHLEHLLDQLRFVA